ncbi:MAG: hypothetical protein KF799_09640, partial [Bdellovibrionales bacterium]|nr:hypothetical protein [Bdellovibrionales bacterium]
LVAIANIHAPFKRWIHTPSERRDAFHSGARLLAAILRRSLCTDVAELLFCLQRRWGIGPFFHVWLFIPKGG